MRDMRRYSMAFKHVKNQPYTRTLHLFSKRAPGFRSIKYHFCFQIFTTWANQQHYKTSPYMAWWFDGSVGIEPFWWGILDKNNIRSFHLCMISGNLDEAWPMYLVWPISERFMLGWSGGTRPACCHWPNPGRVDGRCPIMSVLTQSYQCARGLSAAPYESLQWALTRACSEPGSEQSRSTSVLPINHVIQMPRRLSGFVNYDYCPVQPRGCHYHLFYTISVAWSELAGQLAAGGVASVWS